MAAANWTVWLTKHPRPGIFRAGHFPRGFAYKDGALSLVREVEAAGGEAVVLRRGEAPPVEDHPGSRGDAPVSIWEEAMAPLPGGEQRPDPTETTLNSSTGETVVSPTDASVPEAAGDEQSPDPTPIETGSGSGTTNSKRGTRSRGARTSATTSVAEGEQRPDSPHSGVLSGTSSGDARTAPAGAGASTGFAGSVTDETDLPRCPVCESGDVVVEDGRSQCQDPNCRHSWGESVGDVGEHEQGPDPTTDGLIGSGADRGPTNPSEYEDEQRPDPTARQANPVPSAAATDAGTPVQASSPLTANLIKARGQERSAVKSVTDLPSSTNAPLSGRPPHAIVRARAGCLAADTIINVNRGGKGSRMVLADVVAQFNGQGIFHVRRDTGTLCRSKSWDLSIPTFVARAEDGVVQLGRLINAWFSGRKETFTVTTDSGRSIRATGIHPFMMEGGSWTQLSDLHPGDRVCVDAGRGRPGTSGKGLCYAYTGTKYHPYQTFKGTNPSGSLRHGVPRHRLVVEADMNGMSLRDLIHVLRTDEERSSVLTYLSVSQHVHHKDGDTLNNSLSNLEVVDGAKGHARLHGWYKNVLCQLGAETVVSVKRASVEATYDLEVEDDPHNFLANGFVVHNTGKTWVISQGLWEMKGGRPAGSPDPSRQQRAVWDVMALSKHERFICSIAFNRHIAAELKTRVPPGVDVGTIHGKIGFKAVRRAFDLLPGDDAVSEYRTRDHIAEILGADIKTLLRDRPTLVQATESLVALCKQNLVPTEVPEEAGADDAEVRHIREMQDGALQEMADHYDVDLSEDSEWYSESRGVGGRRKGGGRDYRREVFDLVPRCMERAADVARDRYIDYNDMIWLPTRLGLPVFKFGLLLVDECVPGWTPVMLDNGKSITIREIVESEAEFRVRAYDTVRGRAMNCSVVGKHRILNQRPLVQIRTKSYHKKPYLNQTTGLPGGANHVQHRLVCTIDHKVWTINRGWVPAGRLRPGDDVIIETAAETTQAGKVGSRGRRNLSGLLQGNQRGLGNLGRTREEFNQIKGGNGRGLTTAEAALVDALGDGWGPLTVKTGHAPQHGRGYMPSHYKIDIANEESKVAVEVDGNSHRGAESKVKDRRKQQFLEEQGWLVFRVSNRLAIQNAAAEANKILEAASGRCTDCCPRPSRVISVQPIEIPDSYVYDITVEGCHDFYANGILVHNCQDLNRAQQELCFAAGRRLVFVGDDRQACYGFAGADSESLSRLQKRLAATPAGCVTLPLTVTRRCGKVIVEEARNLVPDFEAHPDNPEGSVKYASWREGHEARPEGVPSSGDILRDYRLYVQDGDMVLCRVNAPLVGECYRFIRQGRRASIIGRKIGEGLTSLVKKLSGGNTEVPVAALVERLNNWLEAETVKERARKHPSEARIMALVDKAQCVLAFCDGEARFYGDVDHAGAATVASVLARIDRVFSPAPDEKRTPQQGGIRLSSIHRAKGLEADRVFFLMPEGARCPHPSARSAWQQVQETNLLYIGITRARKELVYVR